MRDKKKYDIDYARINCRQVKLLLNKEKDKDIIEYLESHKPVQSEIKRLIRENIKKEGG